MRLRQCGEFEFDGYEIGTTLEREFATFVTLRVHGDLRGCIGCLDAREALYRSVHRNTHRAACEDTRFAPVTADEVADIHLGISMLSAQQRIETPEEFEVGRQGVVLHKAGRSAVFLPQVAVEQGWTREETLDALCHKAGLQSGAWREDATFTVFESACLERAGSS